MSLIVKIYIFNISGIVADKIMTNSFHESSPAETESDSGVFTSSYSKYSLDSLGEDKDNNHQQEARSGFIGGFTSYLSIFIDR